MMIHDINETGVYRTRFHALIDSDWRHDGPLSISVDGWEKYHDFEGKFVVCLTSDGEVYAYIRRRTGDGYDLSVFCKALMHDSYGWNKPGDPE